MSVVCRVQVQHVTARAYGPAEVVMTPVYTPDGGAPPEVVEEIRSFFDATPSGEIKLNINNAAAAEQLQPGEQFYLRLDRIEPGS